MPKLMVEGAEDVGLCGHWSPVQVNIQVVHEQQGE